MERISVSIANPSQLQLSALSSISIFVAIWVSISQGGCKFLPESNQINFMLSTAAVVDAVLWHF